MGSTSASTTVISTASICYVSSDMAPIACSGRKKRRIIADGETELVVQPAQSGLETSQSEEKEREGRFLLYWITTTSISSSTSYTTTWSVSSASCTPLGGIICG